MAGIRYDQATDSESASFLPDSEGPKLPARGAVRRNGTSSHMVVPRCLAYTVLLFMFVNFVTLIAILHIVSLDGQLHERIESSLPETLFGKIPKSMVVFKPDKTFNVDPFGPDSLEGPWNDLVPYGKGHIRVENPSTLGLAGGFPLDDSNHGPEEYTIAMFHQLHCLAAIQSKMSRLLDWYHDTNDKEYLKFSLNQEHMSDDHIYHCVDYIRQSIMCSGDTTLEKARTGENGKPARGVDGWNVVHECPSFDAIFQFAAAHRSRNITGIQ
ncbi:protein of unknown function (DUF3328) domain containing protein [Rhypophila decipiens]